MNVGYQGEPKSYSHQACVELFPDIEKIGYPSFPAAFEALTIGAVNQLVLPIENSSMGSILPVLDRLLDGGYAMVAEHFVEVRHALLAVPGTSIEGVTHVLSHPAALTQAQDQLAARNWEAVPVHDTAGAVRLVAEERDQTKAALAHIDAAADHGLDVLIENVIDRDHNTTRFVVLELGEPRFADDGDKSTIAFEVAHSPGALALALTEIGLRGANLTRIESRPTDIKWSHRFFVNMRHEPGEAGFKTITEPPLAMVKNLHHLGTYPAAQEV